MSVNRYEIQILVQPLVKVCFKFVVSLSTEYWSLRLSQPLLLSEYMYYLNYDFEQ